MRKTIAASAVVLAATASLGIIPTATAEQASASHTDSSSVYTRTVSNTTPRIGETVTYTQEFKTTRGDDYIYNWKNNINSCLTYVPGSASLQIAGGEKQALPAGNVKAEANSTTITSTDSKGYWTFSESQPHRFTLDYTVSEGCEPQQTLESGFTYKYRSFFGTSTYAPEKFKGGPALTILESSKAPMTTTLEPVTTPVAVGDSIVLTALLSAGRPEGEANAEGGEGQPPSLVGKKVSFVNGTAEVCEATVAEGGVATCEWTPEAIGTYNVQAKFAGDDDLLGSQSDTQQVRVLTSLPKAPESLSISPMPVTSKVHSTIRGTATPGATVEALAPGGNRCVATVAEDGKFSCTLGYLPAGDDQQITVTETVEGVASSASTVTVNVDGDEQGSSGSGSSSNSGNIWERFLAFLNSIGDFFRGLFR